MIRLGIDARVVQDKPSGLVSYTKNLLRNLIKDESFELFIFGQQKYRSVFSEFLAKENVHFVSVYFNPYFLSLSNFIYESLVYHSVIQTYDLDVFHNPFGFGVPFFLKKKVLLTVHDVIPLYSYDRLTLLQKWIYKKSLSISLSKASHVVAISEFTKNDLRKNFPSLSENIVSVVHNGFDDFTHNEDDSRTFEDLRKKYSLPEKYIIYLGSGTERKNVYRMIEGFILWKKKTQAKHKIVLISKFNRPETAITLTRIRSLLTSEGLLDDMVHIQYVDNESKAALLSHADLFIYPSIYEGFGLPLLEAASCNIPICCSDMPIFHEVCDKGARYFNPFDPESISEAIDTCISDVPLRSELVKCARERILLFSWEKMTAQYIQIYKRIASI